LQRTGTKGGVDQAALCTGGVDAAVESARNFGRLLVELSKDKKRFSKVCLGFRVYGSGFRVHGVGFFFRSASARSALPKPHAGVSLSRSLARSLGCFPSLSHTLTLISLSHGLSLTHSLSLARSLSLSHTPSESSMRHTRSWRLLWLWIGIRVHGQLYSKTRCVGGEISRVGLAQGWGFSPGLGVPAWPTLGTDEAQLPMCAQIICVHACAQMRRHIRAAQL
jgi:hypothetical protein